MGLCCMVVLVAMKKLKEFIDPKMKTETNKVKKGLYKLIWILCTGRWHKTMKMVSSDKYI